MRTISVKTFSRRLFMVILVCRCSVFFFVASVDVHILFITSITSPSQYTKDHRTRIQGFDFTIDLDLQTHQHNYVLLLITFVKSKSVYVWYGKKITISIRIKKTTRS